MTDNAYPHGMFSWADVALPDPKAGAEFYGRLFGWDSEDQTDPDGNFVYTMFRKDGDDVVGLGGLPAEMQAAGVPAMWNSYVTVHDLEAAKARVEASGGKVIDSMEVFDAGSMAIVADPTGATLMLWQPDQHRGASTFQGHGTMSWNELATRDVAKAQAFYSDTLGWRFEDGPGEMEYHLIAVDGKAEGQPYMADQYNGGMLTMDDNWPADMPAHWMVYFTVDNTDDLVAKATELGGKAAVEPFDTEQGRIAVVSDPQGAVFSVIAPSQAVAPEQS